MDAEKMKGVTKGGESIKDEEEELERKVVEVMKKTRRPDTIRYIERKLRDKGIQRMDRHPVDGLGVAQPPPKSGHGGKFTWEGPDDAAESELDPVPPAIDPGDPNYVVEDQDQLDQEGAAPTTLITAGDQQAAKDQGGAEEEADAADYVVIGEVEVAKVAEAREGVSRIEIQPPLQL